LLNAFVAEARSRGVRQIWVASYDFQAPGMYEKAGFKRMAEFEGWPEGHVNVVRWTGPARPFGATSRHFSLQHAQKFSQSHGRPVTMTAIPLQPFSRSPAGSGGRAAVGGDVGS